MDRLLMSDTGKWPSGNCSTFTWLSMERSWQQHSFKNCKTAAVAVFSKKKVIYIIASAFFAKSLPFKIVKWGWVAHVTSSTPLHCLLLPWPSQLCFTLCSPLSCPPAICPTQVRGEAEQQVKQNQTTRIELNLIKTSGYKGQGEQNIIRLRWTKHDGWN